MSSFNPATCSSQDFAVHLCHTYQLCAASARFLGDRSGAEHSDALAAEYLHTAMGYRAEHSDELAF